MVASPRAMWSRISAVVGSSSMPARADERMKSQKGHRVRLHVLRMQQVAQAGFARVVGGHQAARPGRMRLDEADQFGMRARHVRGADQPLVVGDDDRLEGGAERLALPDRPGRQRVRLGRLVGRGVAVVHQLELQVHRRAPQHVGLGVAAVFVEEALVHLARTQVVIDDLDRRMQAFEILDQRPDHLPVGRRVEHDRAGVDGRRDEQAGESRQQAQIVQERSSVCWFYRALEIKPLFLPVRHAERQPQARPGAHEAFCHFLVT